MTNSELIDLGRHVAEWLRQIANNDCITQQTLDEIRASALVVDVMAEALEAYEHQNL